METLIERCAGLDVHKDTVVACVRLPGPGGQRQVEIRSFGSTTGQLLELRDWLVEQRVQVVGMEAYGQGRRSGDDRGGGRLVRSDRKKKTTDANRTFSSSACDANGSITDQESSPGGTLVKAGRSLHPSGRSSRSHASAWGMISASTNDSKWARSRS